MKLRKLLSLWMALFLWMGVIFYLSAQSVLPRAPDTFVDLILKKSAHLSEFAILCWLWLRALQWEKERNRKWKTLLLSLIAISASVAYAFFDEWHQSFTPNRTPAIRDVLIDCLGIALAHSVYIARKR